MDFIEQLFGLSPDNGDGTTEVLWCVVLAILLATAFWWKRYAVMPLRYLIRRQSPPGVEGSMDGQPRFTLVDRTPVGEQEVALVTSDRDLSDAAGLVGTVVLIDGMPRVVSDVRPVGKPILSGQALMIKVEKAR